MPAHWILLVQSSLLLATAAQACDTGDIRMTNSTITVDNGGHHLAGGLQICVDRMWGTVCQNWWDDNDTTVACQQLGLVHNKTLCKDSCFGNLPSSKSYSQFRCSGHEKKLQDCPRKNKATLCHNAVGVQCALPQQPLTASCSTPRPTTTTDSPSDQETSNTAATPPENTPPPTVTTCPQLPVSMCPKCTHSSGNKSYMDTLQGKLVNNEKEQINCSSRGSVVQTALGVIIASMGVALSVAIICLLVTCIKLHKTSKSVGPTQNTWSTSPGHYEMADSLNSDLRPHPEDTACTYSLPVKLKGRPPAPAAIGGDMERVYDQIKTEKDNLTDDAVYSELNHNNTVKGRATCETNVLTVSAVHDQETDSLYHLLESEEHNMYSTIS